MVNELLKILECGNSLGPKFLQFHADWDAFTASDRDAFIALGNTRCRSRGSHGVARKSIAEDHGSRKVSAAFRPFSVSESHETSLRFGSLPKSFHSVNTRRTTSSAPPGHATN